jgi:hypothetical protein
MTIACSPAPIGWHTFWNKLLSQGFLSAESAMAATQRRAIARLYMSLMHTVAASLSLPCFLYLLFFNSFSLGRFPNHQSALFKSSLVLAIIFWAATLANLWRYTIQDMFSVKNALLWIESAQANQEVCCCGKLLSETSSRRTQNPHIPFAHRAGQSIPSNRRRRTPTS